MNHYRMKRFTQVGTQAALAVAIVAALSIPQSAKAGSFQLPTDNAAGWARANAGGSLFPDDPTAAFNNPAAMAFFSGPVFQSTATTIRPSAQFHGEFLDEQGNATTGSNPNGYGRFKTFPDTAFVYPINDRVAIGGSLTVPYGLAGNYNSSWEGRYFGSRTSLQSVAVSFSVAFKVNDEFSMGIGILGQRTKAQLDTTLDPYGSAAVLLGSTALGAPQSGDVQLNVTVKKTFALGYFGGFEWKPTSRDSFGFSYHSQVNQTLSGKYALYGSSASEQLLALAPLLDPSLPSLSSGGGAASAVLNTPAYASIDWLHMFSDRFTMAASVKWTGWSSFNNLTLTSRGKTLVSLQEKYRDTYFASIGGDYKLTDKWTLRGGIGYDQSPTNIVSRDPRIPDGNRRLAGLGVGYKASDHMSFDLGYQHQFVGNVTVHQTNPLALGMGSMNGYFNDSGDVVSLTGTYHF